MIGDLFGTDELFDTWDFIKLLSRLGLDLAFCWLVIGQCYKRLYPENRDFVFTYYIFNIITFSLCILLRKVPMEIGFALGLWSSQSPPGWWLPGSPGQKPSPSLSHVGTQRLQPLAKLTQRPGTMVVASPKAQVAGLQPASQTSQ